MLHNLVSCALMVVWGDIRRQTMARLGSAAELKQALNCLSPEDAWGNRADVDKMFLDGFTSLKHMATVQPDLLQKYGIPAPQTGTLQQLAKEAVAEGKDFVFRPNAYQNSCLSAFFVWRTGGAAAPCNK